MTKRRNRSRNKARSSNRRENARPSEESEGGNASGAKPHSAQKGVEEVGVEEKGVGESAAGGSRPAGTGAAVEVPGAGRRVLLPSLSRVMSVVMLMIGILVVGALFYQVMVGFFVPLFLAALLVVLFRPVFIWLLEKTQGRKRLSAGITTVIILLIVLLPLGMLVSIATTQFTVLLSRMNGSMSVAMDRVRGQLGLELSHADYFRQLDQIVDSIGVRGPLIDNPLTDSGTGNPIDFSRKAEKLDQAAAIIAYLQKDGAKSEAIREAAEKAIGNAQTFAGALRRVDQQQSDDTAAGVTDPLLRLNVSEQFEQNSVITAAAIRTWMHLKLGGALQSQMKLLANPDEADFSRLIRTARESLQPRFVRLTSATGSLLAQILFGLVILVISVYFFLLDGPVMIATLMRLSPMDDTYELQLLTEFDRTSRAVVLASVASAGVQGILATIGFWLCGFDQIVLLMFLTSVMALIPFLGAASVWVPCALWLGVVDQRWLAAGLLALWGAAVVSSIDNVIKVYVLQGRSQLHPLFALLSVIGGVSVFGPIGILVGPMVVVFLQTLLEILNHELNSGNEPPPGQPDALPSTD